jgi:hypothetical protein
MRKKFLLVSAYKPKSVTWEKKYSFSSMKGVVRCLFNDDAIGLERMVLPPSLEVKEGESVVQAARFTKEKIDVEACKHVVLNIQVDCADDDEAAKKGQLISNAVVVILSLAFGPDLFAEHIYSRLMEYDGSELVWEYQLPESAVVRIDHELKEEHLKGTNEWLGIVEDLLLGSKDIDARDKLIRILNFVYETLDIDHEIVNPEVTLFLLTTSVESLIGFLYKRICDDGNRHKESYEKVVSLLRSCPASDSEKKEAFDYLDKKKNSLLSVPVSDKLSEILGEMSRDKGDAVFEYFKDAMKVRNKLFHGSSIERNSINDAVEKLRSVLYHLLMKYTRAPYVIEGVSPRYFAAKFRFPRK